MTAPAEGEQARIAGARAEGARLRSGRGGLISVDGGSPRRRIPRPRKSVDGTPIGAATPVEPANVRPAPSEVFTTWTDRMGMPHVRPLTAAELADFENGGKPVPTAAEVIATMKADLHLPDDTAGTGSAATAVVHRNAVRYDGADPALAEQVENANRAAGVDTTPTGRTADEPEHGAVRIVGDASDRTKEVVATINADEAKGKITHKPAEHGSGVFTSMFDPETGVVTTVELESALRPEAAATNEAGKTPDPVPALAADQEDALAEQERFIEERLKRAEERDFAQALALLAVTNLDSRTENERVVVDSGKGIAGSVFEGSATDGRFLAVGETYISRATKGARIRGKTIGDLGVFGAESSAKVDEVQMAAIQGRRGAPAEAELGMVHHFLTLLGEATVTGELAQGAVLTSNGEGNSFNRQNLDPETMYVQGPEGLEPVADTESVRQAKYRFAEARRQAQRPNRIWLTGNEFRNPSAAEPEIPGDWASMMEALAGLPAAEFLARLRELSEQRRAALQATQDEVQRGEERLAAAHDHTQEVLSRRSRPDEPAPADPTPPPPPGNTEPGRHRRRSRVSRKLIALGMAGVVAVAGVGILAKQKYEQGKDTIATWVKGKTGKGNQGGEPSTPGQPPTPQPESHVNMYAQTTTSPDVMWRETQQDMIKKLKIDPADSIINVIARANIYLAPKHQVLTEDVMRWIVAHRYDPKVLEWTSQINGRSATDANVDAKNAQVYAEMLPYIQEQLDNAPLATHTVVYTAGKNGGIELKSVTPIQ